MKATIKTSILIIVGVLFACIVLALLADSAGDAPTTASAPTAEIAPTAPPATAAPRPTEPPAPTADTRAQDTARYGRTMSTHLTAISGALTDLARLASRPRYTDAAWKIDVAMALATLRTEHTAIQAIVPPESMQAVHAETVAATADFDAMTYRFAAGIDTLDPDEIRAATDLMSQGTRHLTRARELLAEAGY